MTFAQALARIEEILHSLDNPRPIHSEEDEALWAHDVLELQRLLGEHADSIVQLGKVAHKLYMTSVANKRYEAEYEQVEKEYFKLMHDEEGDNK